MLEVTLGGDESICYYFFIGHLPLSSLSYTHGIGYGRLVDGRSRDCLFVISVVQAVIGDAPFSSRSFFLIVQWSLENKPGLRGLFIHPCVNLLGQSNSICNGVPYKKETSCLIALES